eukprot:Skav216927  [mRNA]  locus=scaffold1838:373096:373386:- [translate_table: standard]
MLTAFGLARIFRPKHIVFENVRGLRSHPHYASLQRVIQWCGYRILHQCLSEASGLLPVQRNRLLMLLERSEEQVRPFQTTLDSTQRLARYLCTIST